MRIFHCKTDVKLNSAYPDYIYNILTFTQIIIINNRRCHCHFSTVIVIIITSAIVVIVAILQNLYNKN